MWTALSAPWQVCLEEAWAAYSANSVPIGAVVVDGSGMVQARGRNQIVAKGNGEGLVHNHELAHAELNALLSYDSAQVDSSTALFTLLEPCPLCLGAFYMSGIRELHYAAQDHYAGSANLLGATSYLRRKPIRILRAPKADLEALVVAVNTEYAFATRGPNAEHFIRWWRAELPQAVGLGEALSHSGELRAMRDACVPASQMVDAIATLIGGEQAKVCVAGDESNRPSGRDA
jgi:tRNA(adenine34) deaminase